MDLFSSLSLDIQVYNLNLYNKGSLIILTGSGKSTFGRKLKEDYSVTICCRDELGSTDKCIKKAKEALKSSSVYIDATNNG